MSLNNGQHREVRPEREEPNFDFLTIIYKRYSLVVISFINDLLQ